MVTTLHRGTAFLACVLACVLVGVVVALNGCGASSVAARPPNAKGNSVPDSVRIAIDGPGAAQSPTMPAKPVVTLTDATLVRQLYATIYALPDMPTGQACTLERGPHYTLTFRQGTAPLVTVQANRDGCRPVTIAGQTPDRKGTEAFWKQLDQDIYLATPPANPDRLAIEYTPQPRQAPQSALIASAATAKRLYDAILALPLATSWQDCLGNPVPTYQFVFFAPHQTIPAIMYDSCQSVSLQGAYQSRGGTYAMNAGFKQTLQSVLDGVTLTRARPDQLSVTVEAYRATSHQASISDTHLMLSLYDKVFALRSIAPQPGCPPDSDKIAGKGTFVTFSFSQWSLPLLQFDVYMGSCTYVELSPTGQRLQGDQAFWDLVHQAMDE